MQLKTVKQQNNDFVYILNTKKNFLIHAFLLFCVENPVTKV